MEMWPGSGPFTNSRSTATKQLAAAACKMYIRNGAMRKPATHRAGGKSSNEPERILSRGVVGAMIMTVEPKTWPGG